jgi:hypothetical protein
MEVKKVTQLNMNFKQLVPEMGQETIVTTVVPGWKDTRLKIGLEGDIKGVTLRAYGKALAKTAVNDDPFMVTQDEFFNIIMTILGRQYGADRKIIARMYNVHVVQYSALMSAVNQVLGTKLSMDQKNALTLWIAVVLQESIKLVRWGGPIDIVVSRQTDRIIATDEMISMEHLIWSYINQFESRVNPGCSWVLKFLTDKVGYYDLRTISEALFKQWHQQQVDITRDKNTFLSQQTQFKLAVTFLLKGLPTIPDPLSSLSDLAEFLKISNYIMDAKFSTTNAKPPTSFAEARSFIHLVRAIAASQNSRIEIVPTVSFQKYFTVTTTGFRSGVDGSEIKDISLNYQGSEVIRAGEMVTYSGDYKQWSEDPALSAALSTIVKSVMGHLRAIKDVRLEAWASVVDNMSEVSIWFEESEKGERISELTRIIKAYALVASSWITRDLDSWVYGILAPSYLSMSSSDAGYSMRGTTTRRAEVAVAVSLMDRVGDPLIGNPTPFYKSDRETLLLAAEGEHYKMLQGTLDVADNKGRIRTIPVVKAQVMDTDGSTFSACFPFSSVVAGSYPTTRSMLMNLALLSEVEHLKAQLNESLRFDRVLTGELLVPALKNIIKVATDAFQPLVESEILNFPASMTEVKKNSYRIYTVLNCLNILIAVCDFIEPELATLLNTLFEYALANKDINRTLLGVL